MRKKLYIVILTVIIISITILCKLKIFRENEEKNIWIKNAIPEGAKVPGPEIIKKSERQMYINYMEACGPLNLTTEQKLEDFDFFWNMVREKVFCLEEIAKIRGVNLEKHIAAYRKMVIESKNDVEFYEVLQRSVSIFFKVWHIGIEKPDDMLDTAVEEFLRNSSEVEKSSLFNEKNRKKLKYWDMLLTQNNYPYKEQKSREDAVQAPVPELKILNDKVAVITLPTMMYWPNIEKTGELLEKYMKEIADFEHVIFDLKSNGGGLSMFAVEKIIAPNIDEPVTFSKLIFFKNTEDIKAERPTELIVPEIRQENYIQYTTYPDMPLNDLPKELKIVNGEYGNADVFGKKDIEILPKYNKKILNGKIWVLTYAENYSAAEEFAMACRDTEFATLVGRQTAGDGGAGGIHYFALPNSGLIGTVSYSWRLNADGTVNANEGTQPDIESPEDETPLETCLKAIEAYEKEKQINLYKDFGEQKC